VTPEQLSQIIADALAALVNRGAITLPDGAPSEVRVERPKNKEHGDYATNIALQLAKKSGIPPREFAELLATELKASDAIAAVDIAGPGFINITVEAGAQGAVARSIVEAGTAYGSSAQYAGQKINLEFVSANPTGPVHIGGARWAPVGDSLARVFATLGADVAREYYFNDHGAQIDRFARSLLAVARGQDAPEDGYVGEYVAEIADRVVEANPDVLSLSDVDAQEIFRRDGVDLMFTRIKQTLHGFGVDFDVYFHEQSLHDSGTALWSSTQSLIDRHGLGEVLALAGHPSWSFLTFRDAGGHSMWEFKTLFMQEVFQRGMLTLMGGTVDVVLPRRERSEVRRTAPRRGNVPLSLAI